MQTSVGSTLIDGADVVVVALLVVDTAVIHGLVNAVAVGAICELANLRLAIIRGVAAVGFLVVNAASFLGPRFDFANVDGADLPVVAHAIGSATVAGQGILALVVGATNVIGAGISIVAVVADEATSGRGGVVAELIGAALVGTDIDDAVFALASGGNRCKVDLARGPGHCVDAVGAVGVLLAATGGHNLPIAESILASIDSAGVAVVTHQLGGIWSATLGSHREVGTAPVLTFIDGAADAVIAL